MEEKQQYTYEEYRILGAKEDIKRFEKNMKPFWWENIPIIGGFIYLIRLAIKQQDIDRGILRKEIAIQHMIFLFCLIIYGYLLLSFLTPWFTHFIYQRAINKTKIKINNK